MHSLPMLSLPSWCARAEQVPGESGPDGPPPACTMRTFSPPAAGRACGPDLHQARRRLSAPQRRRHPPGQSCRVRGSPLACGRQPSPAHSPGASTLTGRGGRPALRRWMIRLRMSDGGTRPAATARQCESLLDVAVRSPRGEDGAGAGLPAERSCPPGTDRLAPGLDLANLDQITPAARGSRCMPAAIGCTRGCDDAQGSGTAVPLTAGQLWFVSGPGRLPSAQSAITGCRAERSFPDVGG
jgi:hypothetical protein